MTTRTSTKRGTAVIGLMAAVIVASGDASAAGFQLREQSSEGLGNAYAGTAAKAYNTSTVWYNPAGMTRLEGNQIAGSTSWVAPYSKFSGQATGAGRSGTVRGSSGGDAIQDAAVGSVFGLWDYSRDLKFGIAVTAPFGLRTDYDDNWVGRYHAVETSVTNINVSPSVAYRVTDNLSVGGAVQISYFKAKLSNAINFAGIGIPGATDGYAKLEGDDVGFGGDIGLLYEFSPTTRVGLNYRSQVQHKLGGSANFQNVPLLLSRNPAFANGGISANITTPDYVTLGAYHELSRQWAVMADVQWTNWSTFKELRVKYDNGRPDTFVDESWNDTWFFSLGATYAMDERNKFHFGAAYDMSSVDNAHRTARIPETARAWLATGYTYELGKGNQLNIGYAHLFGVGDTPINEAGSPTTASGNLTGSYKGHADIVSASFVLTF